jgi:hypothetical protein
MVSSPRAIAFSLGARTSGPHDFTFHGGDSAAAASPAVTASLCAPFNLRGALCRGHSDRRSAHPAYAPSLRTTVQIFSRAIAFSLGARTSGPHVFTFHGGDSAEAAASPAVTAVSARHLISEGLCAGGMRTGGPRTQPTHPAHAPLLRIPVIGGSVQLHHPIRPFICNFSNQHVILRVIPLADCRNNLHPKTDSGRTIFTRWNID